MKILHKLSQEVLFETETSTLREANLSRANLSRANLSGANLSRANLSGAKNVIRITGSMHEVFANTVAIWVGCEQFDYSVWQENFEQVGTDNEYTAKQIQEYRLYLELCQARFGKK